MWRKRPPIVAMETSVNPQHSAVTGTMMSAREYLEQRPTCDSRSPPLQTRARPQKYLSFARSVPIVLTCCLFAAHRHHIVSDCVAARLRAAHYIFMQTLGHVHRSFSAASALARSCSS